MIPGWLRSVAKLTKVTATLKLFIHVHFQKCIKINVALWCNKKIRPIPSYSPDVEDHACLVQTPAKIT